MLDIQNISAKDKAGPRSHKTTTTTKRNKHKIE